MDKRLTTSLVVLTCNRRDTLTEMLDDLAHQIRQPDEIIVVDNDSNDGTSSVLELNYPEVMILKLEKNMGCAGRNEGIKKAKGDVIITLDDDILFRSRDNIERIVESFSENKGLSVLNFKILDYETKKLLRFNWFHPYEMEDYCNHDFLTDYISEGAVAFRKEIFEKAGYYPECFFLSHEGPDLAYRILDSGYDINYSPKIEVLHKCSPNQRDPWRNTYYDTRNQIWLAVRNLPFSHALGHIFYRILTTFLFSLRRRQLKWYFKALFDGTRGIGLQKKYRKPISKKTQKTLRQIRRNKPNVIYQIYNFLKRTKSINEKFAR